MPKHLYLFILFTFCTGVLAGVYVFFLIRTSDSDRLAASNGKNDGFEIVVTTYGGCERTGCASLQIKEDGSYVYLVSDQQDFTRYEDALSTALAGDLADLVESTPFKDIGLTTFDGICPAANDGIGYRFVIKKGGEHYDLDSCTMTLDGVPLFDQLMQYFDIMSSTYRSS